VVFPFIINAAGECGSFKLGGFCKSTHNNMFRGKMGMGLGNRSMTEFWRCTLSFVLWLKLTTSESVCSMFLSSVVVKTYFQEVS